MDPSDKQVPAAYVVVVNDEDQHSIWPSRKDLPPGWRATGFSGSKEDCLSHIRVVWTDIRPKSLRDALKGENG
ncbi:MbtH family protein [Bradyrhizobium sp. SZCCHNR3015]|uniref:MbtH family protein n=1 Tax=Bradyrhizobium sp. SZCCHNR3015 TaxID=3057395 RepID=UPI002916D8B8|nr:MbtH family NRPS accessory protein [Bradyrhizobium sp. SZCCHNR3015]